MSTGPDRIAAPAVITLHGVCPGPWQTVVRRVFEPHFTYVPISYSDYDCRRGGAIKAVAHPAFLAAALIVATGAIVAGLSVWWFVASVVLVLAGALVAGVQRRRCANRVKALLSDQTADAYATHVIAHSFGTYLAAHAMSFYDILFDKVVLVGCVLPRRFDWQTLFDRSPAPVAEVRNEVGSSDAVVRLASLTAWLTRELGSAGLTGFMAGRHEVHSVETPWQTCAKCAAPSASVHNVGLARYGHSAWALGIGHALHLWLPYLWGYSPAEFREWVNCCRVATRALQTHDGERYVDAVASMLEKEWTWVRRLDGTPRTLADYLSTQIGTDEAVRGEIMRRLVHAVHLAMHAAVAGDPSSDKVRWRLHPRLAIDYTIADAGARSA